MQLPTPGITTELFYSEKYKQQLAEFKQNGHKWTHKQLCDFFNEAILPQFIYELTKFKSDFNYLNPLDESSRHIPISRYLADLVTLLDTFGVYPDMSDAESAFGNRYITTELYVWLERAPNFAVYVIEPFTNKLKQFIPLTHLGIEYLRLIHVADKYSALLNQPADSLNHQKIASKHSEVLKQVTETRAAIKEIICNYANSIRDTIKTKKISTMIGSISRDKDISQLSPITTTLSATSQKVLQSLPDNSTIESRKYSSSKMLRFNSGEFRGNLHLFTIGIIFLIQQELNQPHAEKPLFNKITLLNTDISRDEFKRIILQISFQQATHESGSYYGVHYSDEFKYLQFLLFKSFRAALLNFRTKNFKADIKDKKFDITDGTWTDILQVFWWFYDKSPIKNRTYFFQDPIIRENIKSAADHIKRIASVSTEGAYILKQPLPPQISLDWMHAYIADILHKLYCDTHPQKTAQYSGNDVLHSEAANELNINFHTLECYCVSFFAPKFLSGVMTPSCRDDALLKNIKGAFQLKEIPNYALDPEKRLTINYPYEEKILTTLGLDILRAHLLNDPRFGIGQEKQSINKTANKLTRTSSSSPLFTSADRQGKREKNTEMELSTFTSSGSDCAQEGFILQRAVTTSYGTNRAFENNSFPLDKEAMFEHEIDEQDLKTLAEDILKIKLVIYSDKLLEQEYSAQDNSPVLHMYCADNNKMHLLLDPFPKASNISLTYVSLTKETISSAHLTKEEIVKVLNSIIPVTKKYLNFDFSSENADFIEFAIAVQKKCCEANSTIPEILSFIKTNMPRRDCTATNICASFNYIFYRYYGKCFAKSPMELNEMIGHSFQGEINPINNNSYR